MLNEPRQRVTTYPGRPTGQVVTAPGAVTCMVGHWYAINVLHHISTTNLAACVCVLKI